jgi:hypothetical protein
MSNNIEKGNLKPRQQKRKPCDWSSLKVGDELQFPQLSISDWGSFPFVLKTPAGQLYKIDSTTRRGLQMTKF